VAPGRLCPSAGHELLGQPDGAVKVEQVGAEEAIKDGRPDAIDVTAVIHGVRRSRAHAYA
jgi:hypothetical protein